MTDLMCSKRISVVAVVDYFDFAPDSDYFVQDSDLQKDLRLTEGIFSTDETPFLQRHRPVGVGT